MMKKLMVVLVGMGLGLSANADEVARGLASSLQVPEQGLSTLENENGVEGYLSVELDLASVLSKPSSFSVFTRSSTYELSEKCTYTQMSVLEGSNFLTQVTSTNATPADDQNALIQVSMLVGDGSVALGEIRCAYMITVEEANEIGAEVMSIDYMLEQGYLNSEEFNFHIDTKQFAIDNSVSA